MFKRRRFTLLLIAEDSDRTLEYKLSRAALWFWFSLAGVLLTLVVTGLRSTAEVYRLEKKVDRLQKEKDSLSEQMDQIGELEEVLLRLQRSNRQLHIILGEGNALETASLPSVEHSGGVDYVSSLDRLRWGRLRSFPSLWPANGVMKRTFSADFQAVFIALPPQSLVRASAAGLVIKAGFDERLGHLVMLDHGNGLASEYGYNQMLLVKPGQQIQKGQPLALSGRSGAAEGDGLYYAVLENGRRRDPQRYRLWL
ncbi:MAG: M23 family metallopeptidase [Candidatus Handelsmanbacteria bacterium]|nr:M23 family metallopeptidase [Candidatus Handelsmanbacteria bacterium]